MRFRHAIAGSAISAAALLGCYQPLPGANPQGCEVEFSKHTGGFISARGRCTRMEPRHGQVAAWCVDGSGRRTSGVVAGQMVHRNGEVSDLSKSTGLLFCGSQNYQVTFITYA